MRGRAIGAAALVGAIFLASAGQAHAGVVGDNDTFFVDTTSDSGALTTCSPVTPDDCSLRGAFVSADDGDPDTATDSIIFDATIFDGNEAVPGEATVVMASAGVSTDENLNLQALCSNTQPCAAIDGPPADIAIRSQNGTLSMRGVAIFDTGLTGLQHSNGAEGLTLTNNWFGLKLDGTVDGNDVGVYLAGPNADVGVTGQPANVFAGNRLGLQMVGLDATSINVQSNLFGVKSDGSTVAANTGTDIDISGNMANQAPSDVLIGGAPNATAACDEGCNVIAAGGSGASPRGIDLSASSGAGFTSTASNVDITYNHIGVNAAGTGATGVGTLVAVGSADNIGVKNNRMAGASSAVFAGSGADSLNVEANSIGASADGTSVLDGTSSSVFVDSSPTAPASIKDNLVVMDSGVNTPITAFGQGAAVNGNQIGVPGVAGSGGGVGIGVIGSSHTIEGNSVMETLGHGILLFDTTGSAVADNEIGVGGSVDGAGIAVMRDESGSVGNAIGSNDPDLANRFGHTGGDAILITGAEQDQNQILANLGGPVNGFMVDLEGTDGPGNGATGPNNGINPPKVKKVKEKVVSGASDHPSAEVWVYRTCSVAGVFPDCLSRFLGTATVKADGTWKLKRKIKKNWVVAALQNDTTGNGSEFTKGRKRKR